MKGFLHKRFTNGYYGGGLQRAIAADHDASPSGAQADLQTQQVAIFEGVFEIKDSQTAIAAADRKGLLRRTAKSYCGGA